MARWLLKNVAQLCLLGLVSRGVSAQYPIDRNLATIQAVYNETVGGTLPPIQLLALLTILTAGLSAKQSGDPDSGWFCVRPL